MRVKLSQSKGVYHERENTYWLARDCQILVSVTGPKKEFSSAMLALKFWSGPAELYRYLPFLVHIYLNGRCREILEFSEAFESYEVFVELFVGQTELRVHSELGCIPERLGIGPDCRELAVLMEWELRSPDPGDLPPLKVSSLPPYRAGTVIKYGINPSDIPRPVFVIGMYRSGTSIFTWSIGRHPNIFPLEETGWLGPLSYGMFSGLNLTGQAKRSFFDVYDLNKDEMLSQFGRAIHTMLKGVAEIHIRRTYLAQMSGLDREFHPDFAIGRSLAFPYDRWVDGTPENTGYAYLIRKLFPCAKFIHVVRHPADVVASMSRFDRIGGDPMEIDEALDFWIRYVNWGMHLALAGGSEVVKTVSYDRLAEEPGFVLDEVLEFLEEPRFRKAEKIFRNKINSSRVTTEEKMNIIERLQGSARYEEALLLYQECLKLASLKRIDPDPESKRMLEDRVNDVEATLRGIFTGKLVTNKR